MPRHSSKKVCLYGSPKKNGACPRKSGAKRSPHASPASKRRRKKYCRNGVRPDGKCYKTRSPGRPGMIASVPRRASKRASGRARASGQKRVVEVVNPLLAIEYAPDAPRDRLAIDYAPMQRPTPLRISLMSDSVHSSRSIDPNGTVQTVRDSKWASSRSPYSDYGQITPMMDYDVDLSNRRGLPSPIDGSRQEIDNDEFDLTPEQSEYYTPERRD
jgi:hypothetical protein